MAPLPVRLYGFRHAITPSYMFVPDNVKVQTMVFEVPGTKFFIQDRTCADPEFNELQLSVITMEGYFDSIEELYEENDEEFDKESILLGNFSVSTVKILSILEESIRVLEESIAEEYEYLSEEEDPAEHERFLERYLEQENAMLQALRTWRTRLIQEREAYDDRMTRCIASKIIQRAYREASGNPDHPLCQRRLQREFGDLLMVA